MIIDDYRYMIPAVHDFRPVFKALYYCRNGLLAAHDCWPVLTLDCVCKADIRTDLIARYEYSYGRSAGHYFSAFLIAIYVSRDGLSTGHDCSAGSYKP